jgi:hypothetical protein
MSTRLGVTFACFRGFGPRFEVATTDEQIVRDEVFHRLTTDSVLGDTPEASDFGLDVRVRLGSRMNDDDIAALGPTLSAVLQRSGRIDTADVTCTRLDSPPGLLSLQIAVSVTTVAGDTFSFIFKLTGSTFEQVGVAGST